MGCDSGNSKPSKKEKLFGFCNLPEVSLKQFSCSNVDIFGFLKQFFFSCSEKTYCGLLLGTE